MPMYRDFLIFNCGFKCRGKMHSVILFLVFSFVCFGGALTEQEIYKVGIVDNSNNENLASQYNKIIKEAAKLNVDMFLLPTITKEVFADNNNAYDKTIRDISRLAKSTKMYIAILIEEHKKCGNQNELFEDHLVFDREGNIVSIHKSPLESSTNCNTTQQNGQNFTTDFGVMFTHVNIKDLLLNTQEFNSNNKNYLVGGNWGSEMPFLTSSQILSSYTRVSGNNLISNTRIYNGRMEKVVHFGNYTRIIVAKLKKEAGLEHQPHRMDYNNPAKTYNEDLSQFIIRPVDLEASRRGLKETVCHGEFCCDFFLKTNFSNAITDEPYSLVIFDGVRNFDSQNIGIQVCLLVACDGTHQNCIVESKQKYPKVTFEEITIQGNFSGNSVQYQTTYNHFNHPLSIYQFKYDKTDGAVTMTLEGSQKLVSFGIYGRDFSKDTPNYKSYHESNYNNIYDYIFNDEMKEYYDYFWIRLRVMVFVVSIYVLEMM